MFWKTKPFSFYSRLVSGDQWRHLQLMEPHYDHRGSVATHRSVKFRVSCLKSFHTLVFRNHRRGQSGRSWKTLPAKKFQKFFADTTTGSGSDAGCSPTWAATLWRHVMTSLMTTEVGVDSFSENIGDADNDAVQYDDDDDNDADGNCNGEENRLERCCENCPNEITPNNKKWFDLA